MRVNYRRLAAHCHAYRKAAGMTMREAAKDMAISPSTLCRIEQERTISVDTFATVCGWMQANPVKFFVRSVRADT